jgi:hypothetical protein
MGWSFRRSINFGPLRINLSKKGAGFSVGGRGFRMGRDARGREYTQISIPGTGIYRRDYYKNDPSSHKLPANPVQPAAGRVPQLPSSVSKVWARLGQPSLKYLWFLTVLAVALWFALKLIQY